MIRIPFWIKVYNRAGLFASMSLFIFQIIKASTHDFIIVIDYNAYGEGMLELFMMCLLGITLSFEYGLMLWKYLKRLP